MAKQIIAVDSQKLNMVQMCGYKYDLTFNSDLVPVEREAPFEKGGLLHRMLETYYKMRIHKDRWPNDFNQTKMKKVCEKVAEHFAVPMSIQIEDVDDNIRVMHEYIDYYWGERMIPLAVEQVGSKILYEDDDYVFIYDTKIDLIAELMRGVVLPVDHKSASRRGPTIAISNQFMGYCWILNSSNIMINKVGFQTSLKPEQKFERPILSYPPPIIENWRRNSIYWIFRILEYQQAGFWPQNFTSCDKYSGCIFRSLCETPPEVRSHKAAQLFNVGEKWDVGALL